MDWISILKCPISGRSLRNLVPAEIELINEKAFHGHLCHADGSPIKNILESGLVTDDGSLTYPIINGIVLLMKELAIVDHENVAEQGLHTDKQKVKDFYEQQGWVTDESGNYKDAVLYEDLRDVSRDYIKKCHDRVSRFLNPTGKYMLDAASGPIQFDEYLQYSANYTYRVCVDFSFRALSAAKRKLAGKGIYILCDITNLPLKDAVMDGFVSLNTVYHIPKDEQVTAVRELYRVLAPGGKGIVVYDWYKHSSWMNYWMLPFRGFVYMKNRMLDVIAKLPGRKRDAGGLYFYAHDPAYFRKYLPPYHLKVWRSLSVHFMRYYIHSWLFGREILNWVYEKEEKSPELCGLKGEYPMLVFEKE